MFIRSERPNGCLAATVHSQDDQAISIEHAEQIYQQLGSSQKELFLVDQTNHVITRDGDTARVFGPITRFIENSV